MHNVIATVSLRGALEEKLTAAAQADLTVSRFSKMT
ncbi:hypothetical protein GGR40_002511 [Novosphingobium gossypii]